MTRKDLDGPENIPLKSYIEHFKLMVIIYNLKEDKIEREVEIDYGNPEERRWLGKVSFWAATNERSVETMSYNDWVATK